MTPTLHNWDLQPLSNLVDAIRQHSKIEKEKVYELWSIPSFTDGRPELIEGKSIGSSKLRVEPNDILISKINPRINRVWIVEDSHLEQLASPEWLVARIKDPNQLDKKYLRYYLSSPEFRDWISQAASSVTGSHSRAKANEILQRNIPLPLLPEQQKIVEILEDHLSRLDAALADVKQTKLKATQFRRSLLQAAFTGNLSGDGTRLMTVLPNGWTYESINSIVQGGLIADGDWVESKDQDPNGQVRLTQLADVGDGEFRSRSDRWMNDEQASRLNVNYLQPGDLLMARMPDPLGRTCMVPENIGRAVTVVDVAIIRITRKDVNPKYIMWLLNSPGIRQQIEMLASGTTRRRITRKNLGTIDLPVPSIDEQQKIVEILEDHLSRLDASVAIADEMEKLSESLRRSLLQAAFTGQLTKEVASV